jgi:pimeloyl-ACP methyl ester carboxylesterase
MDLRGHGDSDDDPQGIYNVDKFVADAQKVIGHSCSGDLVLIGHSLGAEIALRLTAANPGRIKALVLLDGGPGLATDGMTQMRSNFGTRQRDFTSRGEYLRLMSEWLPIADEAMLALAAREAVAVSASGHLHLKSDARLMSMALPNDEGRLWSILETLDCPGLLIRGEASAVLPRRRAEEMVRRATRLQFETVPVAGHAVMMDNPNRVAAILQRFVADTYANIGAIGYASAAS